METKRSWVCTLIVQLSLSVAFYLAINLGQPQESIYFSSRTNTPLDVYFLSVGGGYRDLTQQFHLLKLMENVAKAYKAEFVVNISELGEDDPLTNNARRLFSSMNVSWYTTKASKSQDVGCFLEQINIRDTKTLTVAGVNTESLQDLILAESTSGYGNQLNWPKQAPETATSNWFIVVGYHPVVVCEKNEDQIDEKLVHEPLHNIFMNYGVNMYLSRSGQSCMNHAVEDGVAYIAITDPIKSEPSGNESFAFQKEIEIGFLLHRVGPLEMATYFIALTGEVVNVTVIQQRGRELV